MPIQPNKAVVGDNAFAHESGIHQHGVLAEKSTYEIMTPESIGLKTNKLVLGKHSGRHAFRKKLEEMGYTLTDDEINITFSRFKDLADKKKEVTERDIEALVEHEVFSVPEVFKLEYLHVSSGNKIIPTATVKISNEEALFEEAACGDGPIDAVYKAIDKITGNGYRLEEYSIKAVTGGKDALGEVVVRISKDGKHYLGRGLSTDIIEASAKAYLAAINRLYYQQVCKHRNST
jgi:2-isopropylmalate synthase